MSFDYVLNIDGIDFGFIVGEGKAVFIKVGRGGTYLGYENKYLKMARRLKDKYGYAVIVSSNPMDIEKQTAADIQAIEHLRSQSKAPYTELLFFGHSNGGTRGLELTSHGITFGKMVLVNMPLMINPHKLRRYFWGIPNTPVVAVYSAKDPSIPYVPYLEGKYKNVEVALHPHADHSFTGYIDDFIALSDLLATE